MTYQITAIPEGDEAEFLGWISPDYISFQLLDIFVVANSNKKYSLDANLNGEERAYVMTGEYEKVLPMDIYPTSLNKSNNDRRYRVDGKLRYL